MSYKIPVKCFNCKQKTDKLHVQLLTKHRICSDCIEIMMLALLNHRYPVKLEEKSNESR